MTHNIDIAKQRGINKLSSDVSLAAQPFFAKFGFRIVESKEVIIRGVKLENALMKLELNK
jgi:putative acetyltransferase